MENIIKNWKKILEEFANDADVVKEANIEIYELNKKINDDAIKDYKNRLKNQEHILWEKLEKIVQ